ncbi:MAG: bifunctional oligoribonuclease/PAP phosphatase NrnA [Deltaproteobacteria bacterium]|nr:MAG: bifunctional oligoribonuclease/PAP phosphatase NrnA [Deltaproteobacteria bacterium]
MALSHAPSRWLKALDRLAAGRRSAVALTHDNPDPDAMASAAGIKWLLEERHGLPCELAYGGIIGRAENREFVRVLKVPMVPVHRIRFGTKDFLALVDTQPATGNHSAPLDRTIDLVVDHHPLREGGEGAGLSIVSGDYGATSSIVTQLIRAAGLKPGPELATALFYGVKTDTRSLGRESNAADTEAYNWLFPLSDQTLLTRIEHPEVPRSYFVAYHHAIEAARIYGNVVLLDLGEAYTPDIVPEIAERFIQLEGAKWTVALGRFEEELFLSVRTNDKRRNAGNKVRELTSDLGGSAGGHGQMAGARIPLSGLGKRKAKALTEEVKSRFLNALCVAEIEPERLV